MTSAARGSLRFSNSIPTSFWVLRVCSSAHDHRLHKFKRFNPHALWGRCAKVPLFRPIAEGTELSSAPSSYLRGQAAGCSLCLAAPPRLRHLETISRGQLVPNAAWSFWKSWFCGVRALGDFDSPGRRIKGAPPPSAARAWCQQTSVIENWHRFLLPWCRLPYITDLPQGFCLSKHQGLT